MAKMIVRLVLAATLGVTANAAPSATLPAALALAQAAENSDVRAQLEADVALGMVLQVRLSEAEKIAQKLPPYQHATILLAVAEANAVKERAAAEKLLLLVQTDRALTTDWHKSRIARGLAVAYARLGRFDTAEALAREVPDTEDRAYALQAIVGPICQAGEVARARELAGTIEENRRYGTYRQKAEALALVATALHKRGDSEGAETLLAQAALLLPKKPGWSDGGAMRGVAVAQHACGDTVAAMALLTRADALASAIAGPWKVSEFTQVSAAWRRCGEAAHADQRLFDAESFLAKLAMTDRLPEALALARAQFNAGQSLAARKLIIATLAEASALASPEVARTHHVRTLLTWAELFGNEPLPTT
jgi:Flp pilus assembly protein TadD